MEPDKIEVTTTITPKPEIPQDRTARDRISETIEYAIMDYDGTRIKSYEIRKAIVATAVDQVLYQASSAIRSLP